MSAIPPKHAPDPAPYEAPETGGGLVAMYNAASHANAESFPVLKAFQDYIEAERTQARKRVVQLSVFFAVLMVVVVAGFLTAGIAMWRNNAERENKLLEAVLAQKAAPAPAAAPAAIVQTSPVFEESVRQMSRATSELQSSLDKKLDGVSDIATKVHEKVASQDGELEKMRAELRKMQEQSAKLQSELVSVKEAAKKPAPPAVAAVAPKPVTPKPVTPAPVASADATALAAAATPAPLPAAKPEPRDPRFPPAVKAPPAAPAGVTPPAAPKGMIASAIPVTTKNVGTIPWRVLIPE
jgi:hypothetical protein